ncbi:hypothetical protein [Bifidobacterium catulorum]|uniref:Uncharacterized protein n=1 Tax=Bifidobacterium catulorum TaxID=1630173 RepID=A0A2U2MTU2_9BIFI|nr:hypothetical protein [Bifidobacterium catulorum]PWG60288.1 hypothetical protein DF200_03555 [Bifidobacterium catulorum]
MLGKPTNPQLPYVENQFGAMQDDPAFRYKSAMLLLGMHRWINRRDETTTFTADGNIAHHIKIETILSPEMRLRWGCNRAASKTDATETYIAVPLMFMGTGNLIHRRICDAEGRELPTISFSENRIITIEACKHLWSRLSFHEQLDKELEHRGTDIGFVLKTIIDSNTDSTDIAAENRRRENRFSSLLKLLSQIDDNDERESSEYKTSRQEPGDSSQRQERPDGTHHDGQPRPSCNESVNIAADVLRDYISSHDQVRLHLPADHNMCREETNQQNPDALALMSFLMLVSTLCTQYVLAVYIAESSVQPRMTFTVDFDTSYSRVESDWPSSIWGRLLGHAIGPRQAHDVVDMIFQTYSARSSHMEIEPIDRTVIADVKEYHSRNRPPQSCPASGDSPSKRRHSLRARSAAGRIHFSRSLMDRRPRAQIRIVILPERRILWFSFMWSLLLMVLSLADVVIYFEPSPVCVVGC